MAAKRVSISSNSVEGKVPFLIGVAGGTASGKVSSSNIYASFLVWVPVTYFPLMFQSTVCKRIIGKLGQAVMARKERQVVCISQDSFYRELTPAERNKALKGQFNFDHPSKYLMDWLD